MGGGKGATTGLHGVQGFAVRRSDFLGPERLPWLVGNGRMVVIVVILVIVVIVVIIVIVVIVVIIVILVIIVIVVIVVMVVMVVIIVPHSSMPY